MDDQKRVYDKKIDINTNNTKEFYNSRAAKIDDMECPYTAVLLADQDPEHARKWNIFEKESILPKLKINMKSSVLDAGCGIGRWAESVIPVCGYYFGFDFSSEMIKTAKNRCKFENKNYDFYNASFQEITSKPESFFKEKFDRVIIGGVSMYINDSDLYECINRLGDLLAENYTIYFTETAAVEKRLTLNEFPSEALKTTYDVIYRTPEEYLQILKPIIDSGSAKITEQGFLPHLNSEKEYSETDRWYCIIEKQE